MFEFQTLKPEALTLNLPGILQDVQGVSALGYFLRKADNRVEPAQETEVYCTQQR